MKKRYFSIIVVFLIFIGSGYLIAQDQRINDDPGSADQEKTVIAMNPYGYTVICWSDKRNDTGDIYAQRFNVKGWPYPKNNFKVNDNTDNSRQASPHVAMDHFGRFVIVWSDFSSENYDVYGQLFEANGLPLGPNFKINDDITEKEQQRSRVAMDKNGNFVVCWSDNRHETSFEIYARGYDSSGNPLGPSFMVNDDTTGNQNASDIAMHSNGSFVITWRDQRNMDYYQIYAQYFDSTWVPKGENVHVSTHEDQNRDCGFPVVAIGNDMRYFVCWTFAYSGETFSIYGCLLDQYGNRIRDMFLVNQASAPGHCVWPEISADPDDGYQVVWHLDQPGDDKIWGRCFDEYGEPRYDQYQIIDPPGTQKLPCIGMDNRGISLIAWEDYRNSNFDIYATWEGSHVPLNVTAGSGFDGIIPLTWDPVYGDTEVRTYSIYRSVVSGGLYELVATVDLSSRPMPKSMMDWIDEEVTNGTTYYYVIESHIPESDGYSDEVSATPSEKGYSLGAKWTAVAPIIDGEIDPDEWYDANTMDISTPYASFSIPFYCKYDDNYLYIAADDSNDTVINPMNVLGILVDKDLNGEWEPSVPSEEGAIWIINTGAFFYGYWGEYPDDLGGDAVVPASGVQCGISDAGGHVQYEASFDLSESPINTDEYDRWHFAIWINDPGRAYPYHYGNAGEWPPGALWESALSLGTLYLSKSAILKFGYNWPMIHCDVNQNSWADNEWNMVPPFTNQVIFHGNFPEQLTFYDQTLYVSAFDTNGGLNRVLAYDFDSRTQQWVFDVPNTQGSQMVFCAPAVNDSLVFCGGMDGDGLYSLNRSTGQQVWFKQMGCHHPILDWDRIYVMSDSLYCLNEYDGQSIWTYPISDLSIPVVDGYNVYVCASNLLYNFDKTNGHLRWQVENDGHSSVVVDCQYIYTNHDGKIVARQKLDGTVQWSFSIPSGNISAHIKPNAIALTDSFLCFPSVDTTLKQSQLNVLDKYDGHLVWSETFDSSIVFHPSIANDVIYIVEKEYFNSNPKKSRIWGFQLENGDSLFCDDSNSYMLQPIIANHTLFVPSSEGVQAFTNLTVQVDDEIYTSLPNGFSLSQNYPNPFNPETTIWFNVKEPCQVVLKVFNLMGQEVAHLADKKYQPGQYEVTFNATGFSSGIYLYRIQMGNFQAVKKMVLLE